MVWSNALFHKNRRLLSRVTDPRIPDALADVAYPPDVLADDGSNLISEGRRLYPGDYRTFSENQVKAFIETPRQITIATSARTEERVMQLATSIASQIEEVGDHFLSQQETFDDISIGPKFHDAGALISFGLGMGGHIPLLSENLDFANLVIVEPEARFLIASLGTVDWEPIVSHLERQTGALYFVLETDTNHAMSLLTAILRDRPFAGLEGTFLYFHYTSAFLESLGQRLNEYGPNLLTYNGWIEDDILHLRNHAANTLSSDSTQTFLLDPAKAGNHSASAGPAVISGSGPSLMREAALLKQARNGFTLFSAGTSISALLNNGLRPDFHCELENVSIVADFLRKTEKLYGLNDVTLIASTTVDPSLQTLFQNRIYFIREGDGLMRHAAGSAGQMSLVGPSAVNTAVRIAHFLGYGPIYLIGSDFGVTDKAHGYAKGVLYEVINEINQDRSFRGEDPISGSGSTYSEMTVEVPGARGGTVLSNPLLVSMRHRLEEQLGTINATVFNLGDGALVQGAPYCSQQEFLTQCRGPGPAPDYPGKGSLSPNHGNPLSTAGLPDKKGLAAIADAVDTFITGFYDALDSFESPDFNDDLTSAKVLATIGRYLPSTSGSFLDARMEPDPVAVAFEGSMMRILHVIRHTEAQLHGDARSAFVVASLEIWRAFRDLWPVVTSDRLRHRLNHIEDANTLSGREAPSNAIHAIMLGDVPISLDQSLLISLNELQPKFPLFHNRILVKILSRVRRNEADSVISEALYTHFFDSVAELPAPGPALDATLNALCASYPFDKDDNRLSTLLSGIPTDSSSISNRQRMCLAYLYARSGNSEACLDLARAMAANAENGAEKWTAANYLTIAGQADVAVATFTETGHGPTSPADQLDLRGIAMALVGDVTDGCRHYRDTLEQQPKNPDDFAVPLDFLIRRYGLSETAPMIADDDRRAEYTDLCRIAYENTRHHHTVPDGSKS